MKTLLLLLLIAPPKDPFVITKFGWSDQWFSSKTLISLKIRNTSDKTIAALKYEVIYFDSSRDNREDDRRTLTVEKVIKPGEEKGISKMLDCCNHSREIRAKAYILWIRYQDGTEWRADQKSL